MKVLVLYRQNSEFARQTEEFIQGLQKQHNIDERQLQVLDYDSREGSAMASLYDVSAQPSVIITGDDGAYVKSWQGAQFPLLEEVVGYTLSYH